MNPKLFIGITGGIGSGKTTVCQHFSALGVPIYYTDVRAKALVMSDQNLKNDIIKYFGNEAYLDDGSYNTRYISNIVFKNNSKLTVLNEIIHPAVLADAKKWQKLQNAPYAIKESALIFEQQLESSVDKIITVVAPTALRIERIQKRDNLTTEQIEQRIKNQLLDNIKVLKSDILIFNHANSDIEKQVKFIHNYIITNLV